MDKSEVPSRMEHDDACKQAYCEEEGLAKSISSPIFEPGEIAQLQ